MFLIAPDIIILSGYGGISSVSYTNNYEIKIYMTQKTYYTNFEISQMCGVNPTKVQNWIKEQKLPAFQTPDGDMRISRDDLIAFLKKFGMPIPQELDSTPPFVLIVDDEIDVLNLIEELMSSSSPHLEIAKAQGGNEALLIIDERKPELLILDLNMPGMNGYEVCNILKSKPGTKNIGIVAISGDQNPDVRKRIMKEGADLFFTKPMDIIEFRNSCLELLNLDPVDA